MSALKFFFEGVKVSPYPLSYTLLYGFYAKHPSFQNHCSLDLNPLENTNNISECYSLVFFGDIFPTDYVPKIAPQITDIFSRADLIFGNLECPVTYATQAEWSQEKDKVNFWSKSISEEYVLSLLQNMTIDHNKLILSVANNHAQDWGDNGLIATMAFLKKNQICYAGDFAKDAPLIKIIKSSDAELTVGVLAWTYWLNHPISQRFANSDLFGVIQTKNLKDIKIEDEYDCLIALPHWDFEFQHFPHQKTRELGMLLSEKGFNIIAGSHTHTIQPLEKIRQGYCLYSLGNFINPGNVVSKALSCNLGLIWEVLLNKTTKKITGYIAHPFIHNQNNNTLELFDSNKHQDYKEILAKVYNL